MSDVPKTARKNIFKQKCSQNKIFVIKNLILAELFLLITLKEYFDKEDRK